MKKLSGLLLEPKIGAEIASFGKDNTEYARLYINTKPGMEAEVYEVIEKIMPLVTSLSLVFKTDWELMDEKLVQQILQYNKEKEKDSLYNLIKD